jgi:hypothetical protein
MEGGEPDHKGLAQIAAAVSELDEQYHLMRNEWRAASSIHAMQALFVRNRFLNMVGIKAILPSQLTTETVPDSGQLVQAQLSGSHYENTYEVLESFRAKGLTSPYEELWNKILNGNVIGRGLDENKRKLLDPLLTFRKNRNQRLTDPILQAWTDHPDALAPVPFSFIPDETIRTGMKKLLNIVSVKGGRTDLSRMQFWMPAAKTVKTEDVLLGNQYPEIARRINSDQYFWSDYLILTSNPEAKKQRETWDLIHTVNQQVKTYEDKRQRGTNPIDVAYDRLFRYNYMNSTPFNQALTMLETQDPEIKALFQDAQLSDGPGADSRNSGHGAYRDLGLPLTLNGDDNNPGYYFHDDSAKMKSDLQNAAREMAASAAKSVELYKQVGPQSSNLLMTPSDPALLEDFAGEAITRAQVPPITMARAFPTYKVFFMEDDNSGMYYCYDDFYSYNAILNIEIIRYQDQPDVARLMIANSSNILTHRLFDNSVWGKVEQRDNKYALITPNNTKNEASVSGEATTQYTVSEETKGHVDLTQGFANRPLHTVPLQYFALQPGTKVQVRMGFTNNPDDLFPVFTGRVSEVEEGEVMTVTCESYLVELMSAINTGKDDIPSGTIGGGDWGWGWWRESGDTVDVVSKMLTIAGANHFGRWQIRKNVGNFARGLTRDSLATVWSQTKGSMEKCGRLGKTLAFWVSTLNNGSDRSTENIHLGRLWSPKGTLLYNDKMNGSRPWNYEAPTYSPLSRGQYTFPDNMQSFSPWRIMRDVVRRFPENALLVKPYGFPYGADATLVFGSPNDYYVSRWALYNEAEAGQTNPSDTAAWEEWYTSMGGRAMLQQYYRHIVELISENLADVNLLVSQLAGDKSGSLGRDPDSIMKFVMGVVDRDRRPGYDRVKSAVDIVTRSISGSTTGSGFENDARTFLEHYIPHHLPWIIGQAKANRDYHRAQRIHNYSKDLDDSFKIAQQKRWRVENGGLGFSMGDRFKQVRTWHIVTSEHIIHDGLTLNEGIYNTVRIGKDVFAASEHIPTELRSVLDVTNQIVKPDTLSDHLKEVYAQSFLRDEIGKMYRGELMIAGRPEIEPNDVVLLLDSHRGIAGPIVVESVIHEFSQEAGYITVIRPQAMVLINESLGAGVLSALCNFTKSIGGEVNHAWNATFGKDQKLTDLEKTVAAAEGTVGYASYATAKALRRIGGRQVASWAARKGAVEGTRTLAGQAGRAAGAKFLGTAALSITGKFLASNWLTWALLAGTSVRQGYIWAVKRQSANPLFLLPLTQFDRPWVAGINGWQLSDLAGIMIDNFARESAIEIQSTIEGFKEAIHMSESLQ